MSWHEFLALIRSHYHQPQPTEQDAAESLKRLRELLDAPKTEIEATHAVCLGQNTTK